MEEGALPDKVSEVLRRASQGQRFTGETASVWLALGYAEGKGWLVRSPDNYTTLTPEGVKAWTVISDDPIEWPPYRTYPGQKPRGIIALHKDHVPAKSIAAITGMPIEAVKETIRLYEQRQEKLKRKHEMSELLAEGGMWVDPSPIDTIALPGLIRHAFQHAGIATKGEARLALATGALLGYPGIGRKTLKKLENLLTPPHEEARDTDNTDDT